MALGTFVVTIHGDQLGAGTEKTANIRVQFAGSGNDVRAFIKDADADKFVFPHQTNPNRQPVSLPYNLVLKTDVTSGVSTGIGYFVTVTTEYGGVVSVGPFGARPAGSTIALVDLASDFEGQVAESIALRAESAAAEAVAAKDAAEAVGNTNDTIIAGRINDRASATAASLSATVGTAVPATATGATGGGTTDETSLLQQILDTGADLYVPAGLTFLTTGLNLTADGQRIWGPGTLKLANGAYAPVIAAAGLSDVWVLANVDGNAAGNPLDNGAYTVGGVAVSDQANAAVRFEGCSDSIITSRIRNAHATPAVLVNCTTSVIRGSTSVNHRREGLGIEGGYACGVEDSFSYYDDPTFTLGLPWSLIYTIGRAGDSGVHRHWVRRNYAADSCAAHLTINTTYTIVEDNTVLKTAPNTVVSGPGIRLGHALANQDAHYATVRRNRISGMNANAPFGGSGGNRAISCDNGTGSVIEQNDIRSCGQGIGVSVTASQAVAVVRNDLRSITNRAIEMTSVNGGSIRGNFVDTAAHGIYYQGDATVIAGNEVLRSSTNGIGIYFGAGGLGSLRVYGNRVAAETAGTRYALSGVSGYSTFFDNVGYEDGGVRRIDTQGAAAPTSGTWRRGDRCWNTNVAVGVTPGWVCVAAGTPGTWGAMPNLV